MPANSRWDLIRRLRVNANFKRRIPEFFGAANLGYIYIYIYISAENIATTGVPVL